MLRIIQKYGSECFSQSASFNRYKPRLVCPATDSLELHDPEVWGRSCQHRAWEPAWSDSGKPYQVFSKVQILGEVGDLRIALSPCVFVRCANNRYQCVRVDMGNTLGTPPPISRHFLMRLGVPEPKTAFSKQKSPPPSEIQRERYEDLGRFGRRPALGLSRIHLLPISGGCGGMWALFLGHVALGAARLRLARLVPKHFAERLVSVTHKYSGSPMSWATGGIPLQNG